MLSRREHSRHELEQRLQSRFDVELLDMVLNELRDEGLQSDQRFIESFVSAKVNRGQGPVKIAFELKKKGVNEQKVREQLDSYQGQWQQLARQVLVRKFGEASVIDLKERQKRQRFIAGRGFPNEICYRLFDSFDDD